MSNIVLVTHWTGGEVYPFIRLGKMLKEEGYKVTGLSHCIYEKKANNYRIDFVAVGTYEQYNEINKEMYMLADHIGNKEDYVNFHIKHHGKEILRHKVKLIDNVITRDSVIIARHQSSISGLLVAERSSIPYASLILVPNYFLHMKLQNKIFGQELVCEINLARKNYR